MKPFANLILQLNTNVYVVAPEYFEVYVTFRFKSYVCFESIHSHNYDAFIYLCVYVRCISHILLLTIYSNDSYEIVCSSG